MERDNEGTDPAAAIEADARATARKIVTDHRSRQGNRSGAPFTAHDRHLVNAIASALVTARKAGR